MEASKRIHTFFGRDCEDVLLWSVRTQASLEDKECIESIQRDLVGDVEISSLPMETRSNFAKRRAILIQGPGDRPLRACLSDKDNPYRMWYKLNERYAVANNATRVQLQAKLTRLRYNGQTIGDFISDFETAFNRLAGIYVPVEEGSQVAMFLAAFGDKTKSEYGQIITTIQGSQQSLTWESVTAKLLQEYEEKNLGKSVSVKTGSATKYGRALNMNGRYNKPQYKRLERRKCYVCGKRGHLAKDCRMRNSDRTKENA